MSKSRVSAWSRLIQTQFRFVNSSSRSFSVSSSIPRSITANPRHFQNLPFPNSQCGLAGTRFFSDENPATRLLRQVELDKQRERGEDKKGLDTADIDAEDEEDYMGVGPLIEKLEKQIAMENLKDPGDRNLMRHEEPTDSDSDEDDERFSPKAIQKRGDEFEKKFKRFEELLKNFDVSKTFDDSFKWMNRIHEFEKKHFHPRLEYRVIGELMNRLKEATGKDKFLLQHKLNRAIRLVEWKEAYDPNNPANYGVFQTGQGAQGPQQHESDHEDSKSEKEQQGAGLDGDDDDMMFDDMKETDDKLLEKLNAIDKLLEEKLGQLGHTFGRKGKVLEGEIKDLAEERSSLTEKKRRPLYMIGFDEKMIDVNRTVKVTKGGQLKNYTAIVACGNYHGVIGFAEAKASTINVAIQKAREKCFQNLHYVERHEHTIAHAIQASYKKTKAYLWPGSTQSGMSAGRHVQTILHLAGFRNVKSKVVGSRNPP